MTLEYVVFFIALLPVLLRAWQGWRFGATREIRHTILYLFGMLVALRFWYPVTLAISQWINRDARLVAAVVFTVLFFLAAELASLAIRFRAEHFESVQENRPNQVLGSILGLVSGALLGGSLLLIFSMELPAMLPGFDPQKFPLPLEKLPVDIFRGMEKNIAGISEQNPAHTPLPEIPATGATPAQTAPAFVWK